MTEGHTPGVSIVGKSVKGQDRRLTLIPGQPGMVALTIHVGDSQYAVVVPVETLRSALDKIPR